MSPIIATTQTIQVDQRRPGPMPDRLPYPNRSCTMYLMNEDLARAQMSARLGEAPALRRGHQLARAARLSRKAQAAQRRAGVALARVQ